MRVKKLKLRAFIEQRVKNLEPLEPTAVMEAYNARTGKNLTLQSTSEMLIAMGYTKEKREQLTVERAKQEAGKDILEYPQYKNYLLVAEKGRVQQTRIRHVGKMLREMWEWLGKIPPEQWTYENIMQQIDQRYSQKINEQDQKVYLTPGAVKDRLGCVNTVFPDIIPPNFSGGLTRTAGELKDFLNFVEMDDFLSNVAGSETMAYEGWIAEYVTMVNSCCREGSRGNIGITGLLWQDIDMNVWRCSIREKGHRGHAGERWINVPLNMFPWLHGAERLKSWWEKQGRPTAGKVFPVSYKLLSRHFEETRHKCKTRIKEDTEAMRLHTFGRKTHAVYCKRLGLPLELICGKAPSGRFGVGWKDPAILVNHYLSEESEEIDPQELAFMQAHPEYAKVLASMQEQNRKIKELLGAF